MKELTQDLNAAILAFLGVVTAARMLVVMLQKLAAGTPTEEDEKVLGRVAAALGGIERALDWVSVGPTSRKR